MRNLKVPYTLILLLVTITASAQHMYMTVGANLVIPTSSGLKMDAGNGFGGSLGLETTLGKHINGIATVQYLSFSDIETSDRISNFKAVPIQIGIKYYATSKPYAATGLFFSGETGIMPTTLKFKYESGIPDYKYTEMGFTLAPGLGYQLGRAEAGFRTLFNLTSSGFDVYYLDFRLAYRFF